MRKSLTAGWAVKARVLAAAWVIAVVPLAQVVSAPPASAVSPGVDGDIFFSSAATGSTRIWRMHADGSGARPLSSGDDLTDDWPAVSPDGRFVVFSSTDGSHEGIDRMRADRSHQVHLSGGVLDGTPSWSPDGRHIVFTRAYGYLSLMNADGTRQHSVGGLLGQDPSYSPDGRRILFHRLVGDNVSQARPTGIASVRPDGTGLRQLTSNEQDIAPSVSPDGRHIVFLRGGEPRYHVYRMNADGSGVVALTPTGDDNEEAGASWSPDGRHIVFFSNHSGRYEIWVMNPDGSNPVMLAGSPTDDVSPSWGTRPATCHGHAVTIAGTSGPDVLSGTPGPDVLSGRGGDARIHGLGGNDVLCGGTGKASLFGGAGADRLYGGTGRDRYDAGPGRDRYLP